MKSGIEIKIYISERNPLQAITTNKVKDMTYNGQENNLKYWQCV